MLVNHNATGSALHVLDAVESRRSVFASAERRRWETGPYAPYLQLVRADVCLRGYKLWAVADWLMDERDGGPAIVEQTAKEADLCCVHLFRLKTPATHDLPEEEEAEKRIAFLRMHFFPGQARGGFTSVQVPWAEADVEGGGGEGGATLVVHTGTPLLCALLEIWAVPKGRMDEHLRPLQRTSPSLLPLPLRCCGMANASLDRDAGHQAASGAAATARVLGQQVGVPSGPQSVHAIPIPSGGAGQAGAIPPSGQPARNAWVLPEDEIGSRSLGCQLRLYVFSHSPTRWLANVRAAHSYTQAIDRWLERVQAALVHLHYLPLRTAFSPYRSLRKFQQAIVAFQEQHLDECCPEAVR